MKKFNELINGFCIISLVGIGMFLFVKGYFIYLMPPFMIYGIYWFAKFFGAEFEKIKKERRCK